MDVAQLECPFCEIVANGWHMTSNESNVAFEPLRPVTAGHFLVVPREHVASALEAPSRAASAMAYAAHLAQDRGIEAANFITSAGAAATQTVMHLHVHVVPRAAGDGLILPWTWQGDAAREAARAARYGEPTDTYTWDRVADKVMEAVRHRHTHLIGAQPVHTSYEPGGPCARCAPGYGHNNKTYTGPPDVHDGPWVQW